MRLQLFIVFSFLSLQASAQSVVNLIGQIKNAKEKNISIIYSNSWLDPKDAERTVALDDEGKFKTMLQFKERMKTAYLVYASDTLEIVFTSGETPGITADAVNFKKTIHFDGTGAGDFNFCIKHNSERGMMSRHSQTIHNLYKKNINEFIKAIKLEHKKELDYLAKYGKEVAPVFSRFWRLSYQYDIYCNMYNYTNQHPKPTPAVYRILDSIPDAYNDEYMLVPQYRSYVLNKGDNILRGLSPSKKGKDSSQRKKAFEEFVYTKLPPQSGEFVAASYIFDLVRANKASGQAEFEEFKKRFPESTYSVVIKYLLKG